MPDGRLQSTVVWFDREGDDLRLNTMREFQKARNLGARPRATMFVMEPDGQERWIEVRGTVTMQEEGAVAHLNGLCRAYVGVEPYFGRAVPAELEAVEHPMLCRLHPAAVTTGPGRLVGGGGRRMRSPRLRPSSLAATMSRGSPSPIATCSSDR